MKQIPRRISMVVEVADLLREEIAAGRWKGSLPGLRSLSGLLGVGRSTLEQAEHLLQTQGVIQITHGRRPRIALRPRRNGGRAAKSHIVRSLVTTPLFLERRTSGLSQIISIQRCLHQAGFELEVHSDLHLREEHSLQHLKTFVEHNPAACWVLFNVNREAQQWFMEQNMPCLLSGYPYPGIRLPSFDLNYEATCRHAVGKFLRSGHKQIALLMSRAKHAGDLAAEAAFRRMVETAYEGRSAARVFECDDTVQGIRRAAKSMVRATPPVTGVLVINPSHTLTMTTCLSAMGKEIPRDLSVLCACHEEFLDCYVPSIAGYRLDQSLFSKRMSRLVVRLATEGYIPARAHRVTLEFKPGDSFRPRSS